MEPISSRVQEIIGEHLDVGPEEVRLDTSLFDDLGADSLDVVELALALEDEFGLQLPDEELESIRTVKDVVDYIAKSTGVAI